MSRSDQGLLASVSYQSGQSLALRCFNGRLEALMTGLPIATEAGVRTMDWDQGDYAGRQTWINIPGRPAVVSTRPLHTARLFKNGGAISLRLPASGEASTAQRYELALPSDSSGVEDVLKACNANTDAPRDSMMEIQPPLDREMSVSAIWSQEPTPDYPSRAANLSGGAVLYSCVVAERGALQNCRIEAENPPNVGFGAEALKALRTARLRLGPGVEPGRLTISRLLFVKR